MTTRNNITGDKIQTKVITNDYRDNYDVIFRKVKKACKEVDTARKEASNSKLIFKGKK